MGKDEINMNYTAWRLAQAERRKELRGSKSQGIPPMRSSKPKFKSDMFVPSVPSTSRTIQIKSNQDSVAAHEAALAMLELDKEIEEEIDADAIREMQECNLDESQDINYREPTPTFTVDTIPHGFTPKDKTVDDESSKTIKTKPRTLFAGPNTTQRMQVGSPTQRMQVGSPTQRMQVGSPTQRMQVGSPTRWTTNNNDNINDWSLKSLAGSADEEDQFMQLMEMGDDMDIDIPLNKKST
jgi:hypothetical protein